MTAAEIAERIDGIRAELENKLDTDYDRQYAAESCISQLRELAAEVCPGWSE